MTNGTFKMKMDIDRHGPRLMPNNCKNLNPPYFSLPSTFKYAHTKLCGRLVDCLSICPVDLVERYRLVPAIIIEPTTGDEREGL